MNWHRLLKKNTKTLLPKKNMEAINITAVVLTDVGNIRTNNEDMGLFYKANDEATMAQKGYLLLVADGMGGHQAGEVASNAAAEIISQEYFNAPEDFPVERALRRAFRTANHRIYQLSSNQAGYKGMGTTCTAVVITGQQLHFAHVGDSRAYLLKGTAVHQITEDHTYVQELVKQGEISQAEAASHPKRNILTNAMGTKSDLRVDTGLFDQTFDRNDRILLCSDGLYDYLSNEEIGSFTAGLELRSAAELLIAEAKKRGGHDNITVVLAEQYEKPAGREIKSTQDIEVPITKEIILP